MGAKTRTTMKKSKKKSMNPSLSWKRKKKTLKPMTAKKMKKLARTRLSLKIRPPTSKKITLLNIIMLQRVKEKKSQSPHQITVNLNAKLRRHYFFFEKKICTHCCPSKKNPSKHFSIQKNKWRQISSCTLRHFTHD